MSISTACNLQTSISSFSDSFTQFSTFPFRTISRIQSRPLLLIIIFTDGNRSRKALDLLRSHSADPDSPLSGHSRTVNYLQNLGPNHIEIVLEFSLWVILSSPEDGLTIFTEDLDTVETLPRAQVLNWLLKQVNKRKQDRTFFKVKLSLEERSE